VSIMTPCAFVITGGRGLDEKQIRSGTRVTGERKVDRDRESSATMGLLDYRFPGMAILSFGEVWRACSS